MTYEDRLFHQLSGIVAATPAPVRHRSVRRPLAAGATATAAAAAVIAAVTGGSEPAYAVQSTAGDTVTVTINDIRDAAGLQARLRAAGVPADVRYVPDAPRCTVAQPGVKGAGPHVVTDDGPSLVRSGAPPAGAPPAGAAGDARPGSFVGMRMDADGHASFTVSRDTLAGGRHLTITAAGGDLHSLAIAIGGSGDAPPPLCLP